MTWGDLGYEGERVFVRREVCTDNMGAGVLLEGSGLTVRKVFNPFLDKKALFFIFFFSFMSR